MITERTLRRWRRDALKVKEELTKKHSPSELGSVRAMDDPYVKDYLEVTERLLRMTQELLDQHMLRKAR